MKTKFYALGLFAFLLMSCGHQPKAQNVAKQSRELTFQLPEVPVMLQSVEDRINYVVQHYWDHFNFKDTAYIHAPDVTEQAAVNYLDLLTRIPKEMADTCFEQVVLQSQQEPKMEEYLTSVFRRYLMDPNSPLRNEDLYEPVAKVLSTHADPVVSSKAALDLRMIRLNRRGSVANDFVYTLFGGAQRRMHQLEADYLVLFFYDPDCDTCQDVLRQLKESELLKSGLQTKKIKVLALYPDEDLRRWEQYRINLPDTWLNAYDKEHKIMQETLYDLKALPSLYLLDHQKKVLLKDVYWSKIEKFLGN